MALRREEYWGLSRLLRAKDFLIKNLIKRRLPEYSKFIDVGTVHTFQGRSEKSFCFPVCMEVKMGVILLTEHRIL